MFDSIYIGLSGLSAYTKGLQVVSNNISNMNTLGFKSSDVTFGDLFGPGSSGGLAFGSSSGGGQGVSLNDISINFNPGELRQTGKDLDLAIDGNGFFVLLDGKDAYYTRTGSFSVSNDGYIVLDGTNYRLAVLDANGRPVALNIDSKRTEAPAKTDRITFADNLSSSATTFDIPDVSVYGADGTEHKWSVNFTRPETSAGTWTVKVTDETGTVIGTQTLQFTGGAVDPASQQLLFEDSAHGLSVTFDFSSNVTSFSSGTVSSLRAADVTGHATGSISTVKVNDKGELEITYTNNDKVQLGSIALADFRDPQALEQRSKALFVYTGFGQLQYLAATDTRVGTISGGKLEASNVDLGAEFGNLILIQRGFQASSQVISVTNDMIQQLFGIRGQG